MDGSALKYPPHSEFRAELGRRVARHFEQEDISRHGGAPMVVKTVVIAAWFLTSYGLLVFWAVAPWQVIALTVSAGLAFAAIGFNIQHDGGHHAYSSKRWVNRLMAFFLDAIGGSSYVWRFQHNVLHHTYTNIDGADDDINLGPFGRLAPAQRRRRLHRYQHLYVWFLYGLLPMKWWFWDDYAALIRGRIGSRRIPRPAPGEMALLIAGKLQFYVWAIGVPLLLHSWAAVAGVLFLASFVAGVTMAVVFQLAHCVGEADFPIAGALVRPFEESQVETTTDFAQSNRLITWYVGGLNFQIEHHLFPKICHLHYPKIAPIVRQTCDEFGVWYRSHASLGAAVGSHVRWLRRMGRQVAVGTAVGT